MHMRYAEKIQHIQHPSSQFSVQPAIMPCFSEFFLPAAMANRSRSHFVSQSVSQSVTKTQMSHLETSNADSAQSKDDWNENL